ncbi:MAG: glycine zipper 2TM domain-containing protein [Brevundimonas sp.]|uniref:glycine zipper 2TM domain-containing protein n=1 Tax=Brevundimonas sp. TaxID=1871086 RepID=UPI002732C72D|nr:glycine zipper 2TM domain-containing protein [Brevundimonas sp.]MDP3377732.1 glycine zipper 2TM domain-containing protein [Brevundimonas sp.]
MRSILTMTTVAACGLMLSGCATAGYGDYASACERDYAKNRERAISAGAVLGAAVGAAIAGEGNREQGALIGAAAGALLGSELSAEDDPCGYGFAGYNRDYRYGRERVYWRDDNRRW